VVPVRAVVVGHAESIERDVKRHGWWIIIQPIEQHRASVLGSSIGSIRHMCTVARTHARQFDTETKHEYARAQSGKLEAGE
jgi:hypothetical protein